MAPQFRSMLFWEGCLSTAVLILGYCVAGVFSKHYVSVPVDLETVPNNQRITFQTPHVSVCAAKANSAVVKARLFCHDNSTTCLMVPGALTNVRGNKTTEPWTFYSERELNFNDFSNFSILVFYVISNIIVLANLKITVMFDQ